MKATLVYKTHFNAAYRTYNPYWSKAQNEEVFGENAEKTAFRGYNYDIEIHVCGQVDTTTGTVMASEELGRLVKEQVEKRYDHRNLYEDVEDFKNTVPTSTMLAYQIWQLLRPHIPSHLALKVILYESHQLGAIYEGE